MPACLALLPSNLAWKLSACNKSLLFCIVAYWCCSKRQTAQTMTCLHGMLQQHSSFSIICLHGSLIQHSDDAVLVVGTMLACAAKAQLVQSGMTTCGYNGLRGGGIELGLLRHPCVFQVVCVCVLMTDTFKERFVCVSTTLVYLQCTLAGRLWHLASGNQRGC